MDFDSFEKKAKEIWENNRYKSLIKLGLYVIIVIIALMFARSSYQQDVQDSNLNVENQSVEQVLENFKDLSNFKATYDLDGNKYIYTYVNKELLKVNNNTYFIEDGKLVDSLDKELEVPKFEFDFWRLNTSFISGLFVLGEEQYTKKYTSGKIEIGYLIELKDFLSVFDGVNLQIDDIKLLENKDVELVVTILKGKVICVKFDLSSFYNLIDSHVYDYILNIYYE